MPRKKRSQFYADDRRRLINRCKEIRSTLPSQRSGVVIHSLEIELQYIRDSLVLIRRPI